MTTMVMNRASDKLQTARFVSLLPLAGAITLALFLLMRFMISTQFEIPEPEDHVVFDINPVIKELPLHIREAIPERMKDVTPPPPPPRVSKQTAQRPDETIAALTIPDLNPQRIQPKNLSFIFVDRDAQPIIKIEPIYPPRAIDQGREGTCKGMFDVSAIGRPYNISVTCSSSLFVRASTRAIEKWKYNPKIIDGKAVVRRGVATSFSFNIKD